MKKIDDLPAEKLVEVFQRLPPSSLKDAILVSRRWKNVGDYPALWKWCKVTVYSKEDVKNLGWGKLKKIREIRINPQNWDVDDFEAFFLVSMELRSLRKIDGLGRYCGFSGVRMGYEPLGAVNKGVFAKALAKLEEVDLEKSPYDQIEELFTEMWQKTRIKKFHLSQHDLSQMDPGLFAIVLSRVEDIRLYVNKTTKEQMTALFTQILEKNCLKKIDLNEFSVSYLEPTLLAQSLAGLEEVKLRRISLVPNGGDDDDRSNDQIAALFTELSQGTRLRKLELLEFDLSVVDTTVFAKTLSRMEILGLEDCEVTRDQMQALLTEISLTGQTKKLKFPNLPLSQLEPELLAGVLTKIEDVILYTPKLVVPFFTKASVSTPLITRTLYMGSYVDFSSLDPNVLATLSSLDPDVLNILSSPDPNFLTHLSSLDPDAVAHFSSLDPNVLGHIFKLDPNIIPQLSFLDTNIFALTLNRLESLTLRDPIMTDEQYRSLFSQMTVNTQLKKLDLSYCNISFINPQVLASALNGLDEIKLSSVGLTHDQVVAFFSKMAVDTKLKKLKFCQCDLSALEDVHLETIGIALNRLEEAYLWGTGLSLPKISTILASVLEEGSKLKKLEWGYELEPRRGRVDGLNTETVSKVQDKLKGQFVLS